MYTVGNKYVKLTNRKSHTTYRLVLKLVTLKDLERRNDRNCFVLWCWMR